MTKLHTAGRSTLIETIEEAASELRAAGSAKATIELDASQVLAIAHYVDNVLGHTADMDPLPLSKEDRSLVAGYARVFNSPKETR